MLPDCCTLQNAVPAKPRPSHSPAFTPVLHTLAYSRSTKLPHQNRSSRADSRGTGDSQSQDAQTHAPVNDAGAQRRHCTRKDETIQNTAPCRQLCNAAKAVWDGCGCGSEEVQHQNLNPARAPSWTVPPHNSTANQGPSNAQKEAHIALHAHVRTHPYYSQPP